MSPFDKAWTLLKFENLQSEVVSGYSHPAYSNNKAIGLTWAQTPDSPAKPSINLRQRNPDRTAPRDAFFNTDDADTVARRLSLIDAHEALGHGEDPILGPLLNVREYIRENMPEGDAERSKLLSQLSAAIEAPGITMEELVNESLYPEVGDTSLSERVRANFAERAGEPGAMFGGGDETLDPEEAMENMSMAERIRGQVASDVNLPMSSYSTFGKAWDVLKMPQEARALAEQQHEGQMYGEEPYMTHVDAVASQFDDPHMQRIAYLHDTVEDGKIGIDDIHEQFGEDVGHAVDAMTRRQDESYFDYIARVGEHPEARRVKMADLTHNLSGDPPGSLRQRYEKALEMLS